MGGVTRKTPRIARVSALAAAVALLLLAFTAPASANRLTFGNPAFCAPEEPVGGFSFSRLPPLREVPLSAKELGHGAVMMHGGRERVRLEAAPFGYEFSAVNYGETVRLDWTVTAELWVIDRRGAALREVDDGRLFIGRLNAADEPSVKVSPPGNRRGVYRFEMRIANKSGKVIGSYGAYFRVVLRRSWRPRLRLTRDVLRAGERLLMRVENHGSEPVGFGAEFGVQRLEGDAWVTAPGLAEGPWIRRLWRLGGGGVGGCGALALPSDTPPGQYRITKGVLSSRSPGSKRAQLTAPFVVVDTGAKGVY
jgi:hypothetical protein